MHAGRLILFSFLVLPTAAFAHTGVGGAHDIAHGFMHPLLGLDHILAMVAVGILAACLGGRALWLVPASFVLVMALAGVAGAVGVNIPYVEIGVVCTVIVLGLMIAFGMRLPLSAAVALVGFFAIFHGHAHGAELPEDSSGIAYGVGFLFATAMLHALGIGIGLAFGRFAEESGRKFLRGSGYAISLAGVGILLGLL